jgi:hypothetical protein
MLKPTKGQFIVNKAGIRSREENVAVYLVFKVLAKMISAFKRDYWRDVIITNKNTLCRHNKFSILWVVNICYCTVL